LVTKGKDPIPRSPRARAGHTVPLARAGHEFGLTAIDVKT